MQFTAQSLTTSNQQSPAGFIRPLKHLVRSLYVIYNIRPSLCQCDPWGIDADFPVAILMIDNITSVILGAHDWGVI